MKKIIHPKFTTHFASTILLVIFSSSVVADKGDHSSLIQLSVKIEDLARQLQTLQHQVNTQFTANHFISVKNNKGILAENAHGRRGRNKKARSN